MMARSTSCLLLAGLTANRFAIEGDRYIITENPCRLTLSFFIDEAVRHFIVGLFGHQKFRLGDKISQTDFEVSAVQALASPVFQRTMQFRLMTPLCISRREASKAHAQYIAPDDADFEELFFAHLHRKYQAAPANTMSVDFELIRPMCSLRILSAPKSKLLHIKNIQVRGYVFDFEIIAPPELIAFGYFAGFGEKNSGLGCGMVRSVLNAA